MNHSKQILQGNDTDGFQIEELRKKLLFEKKYDDLKQTYSPSYPEISDGNSGKFWDKKFANEKIYHHMEFDRNKLIANWIIKNQTRFKKIIDLGVGKGLLEKQIYSKLNKLIHLTGTDITDKQLLKLKQDFKKWKFIKSNLIRTPLESNSFDLVMLLEVLEHIRPSETFLVLKNVKRLLKKDGYFILSIPVNEGLESMYPNNPNQHLRVYSEELVKFELDEAGFRVENVLRLSAFSKNYEIKKLINNILHLREPNNLIFFARLK